MINEKYSNYETITKRNQVRETFCQRSQNIKSGDIKVISVLDLSLLFRLYDEVFLGGYFENTYKGTMDFSLSKRMTRSAGTTRFPKNITELPPEQYRVEIKISVDFLFNYYKADREKQVSGIITNDPLDALMLVLEHELCHVIEVLYFGKTNCKGVRFKEIVNNIFGHTDVYHKLPTSAEIRHLEYGFKPGDNVSFECEGKGIKGIINRINKRATVMVEDKNGAYIDMQGKRCEKYLVPLNMLKKIVLELRK